MMPRLTFLVACILSIGFLTGCIEQTDHPVKVEQAYGFATMPGAMTGAAFMKITNTAAEDDALIGAKSTVAEITEIHENILDDDGTMMMRKIPTLSLPAGKTVILQPKGYHIMFMKLRESLGIDQTIPVTLQFEKAGNKTIDVRIIPPGAKPE